MPGLAASEWPNSLLTRSTRLRGPDRLASTKPGPSLPFIRAFQINMCSKMLNFRNGRRKVLPLEPICSADGPHRKCICLRTFSTLSNIKTSLLLCKVSSHLKLCSVSILWTCPITVQADAVIQRVQRQLACKDAHVFYLPLLRNVLVD